jgi:hypothetical protein
MAHGKFAIKSLNQHKINSIKADVLIILIIMDTKTELQFFPLKDYQKTI